MADEDDLGETFPELQSFYTGGATTSSGSAAAASGSSELSLGAVAEEVGDLAAITGEVADGAWCVAARPPQGNA